MILTITPFLLYALNHTFSHRLIASYSLLVPFCLYYLLSYMGKSLKAKLKSAQNKVKAAVKVVKAAEGFADRPFKTTGGFIGKKLGSQKAGSAIGGFLGKISGTGDYFTVSNNSLATHAAAFDGVAVPSFNDITRGTRVVHREYLGDVVASSVTGAFNVTSYALNPGLFTTFPWLCSFAQQYDQWKPNGMVVIFKSLSSSYSGTASLGTVILSTDYDVIDPAYASKVEMENAQFAVSGNSAQSLMHPIECSVAERMLRVLNIRSGDVATTDNKRWYDLGNLQVATAGCSASQVVGELWISYDITLYKPQLYGGISGRTILSGLWEFVSPTTASPFGTSMTAHATNNFALTASLTDLTFPSTLAGGSFAVTIIYGTAALSDTTQPTLTYSSTIQAGPVTWTGWSNAISSAGTSMNVIIASFNVSIKAPSGSLTPPTVTVTGITLSGASSGTMHVTQINPNVV